MVETFQIRNVEHPEKNPDHSLVFRSELVAIREALNLALDNRTSNTWILTDSKSSIQFLKDWSNVLGMLGQEILSKLSAFTQVSSVCFQWIPSHVGVYVNEVRFLGMSCLLGGQHLNMSGMPLNVRGCPSSAPVLDLI
ncbi:RNase H domain-containing protein [Trichonephila clavata]|uniref:RNase H domain-containing protein n=1 Tax=Trichonephila clavata TaxID=2740835 RepID=A0A8X6M1B4_TRICU|nr:RNase H domain-containing protein [Trichonephila clavata]